MERYQSTIAIVIKKRVYQDSDYFITLLTPNSGKISCLAKGVKNIKSHRLGSLELGNIIKAHFYSKNDFLWLSETQIITPFLLTETSLTQFNLLFYILEIVNHFIADNQVVEGIYPIVNNLIDSINQNHFYQLVSNEIKFIETLGFGVPPEILSAYDQDLKICQSLIKKYLESIIEKPLESNKLFK